MTTVSIALLSHTNAGKTTLARTLLRRDIGAVMDRAHVTEVAESHVLLRSPAGDEFVLWDTPGFGDSVRLQRRLAASGQPLGWFLSQVWDRFADRAFWCSQQAMRAARDSADVVLYVVNASEDAASGYIEPELRILDWLGKPALVLLNQVGTRTDPAQERSLVERWEAVLRQHDASGKRRVLTFDAFARCWLQEHTLLEAIGDCLAAGDGRVAFERLAQAWRERDLDTLRRSAGVIAEQLQVVARDEQHVPPASLAARVGRALQVGQDSPVSPAEAQARASMVARLDAAVRESTASLVALHGLTGSASEEILRQVGTGFATTRAPDADKAGLLGGLVSGALTGIAADVAAGGLTFGAGALLGGIAGAFGARKLTQHYNAGRGVAGDTVRWSDEFLEARLAAALLRYLAVAHFGRGRGEFVVSEPAPRWEAAVTAAMARRGRSELWARMRGGDAGPAPLQDEVLDLLFATLRQLYPEPSAVVLPPAR